MVRNPKVKPQASLRRRPRLRRGWKTRRRSLRKPSWALATARPAALSPAPARSRTQLSAWREMWRDGMGWASPPRSRWRRWGLRPSLPRLQAAGCSVLWVYLRRRHRIMTLTCNPIRMSRSGRQLRCGRLTLLKVQARPQRTMTATACCRLPKWRGTILKAQGKTKAG